MLDCLGEKHPSSATSQIILPLKSQQSDKKSVSYSRRKKFIAKKIETYPNWDGKDQGRKSISALPVTCKTANVWSIVVDIE